MLKFLLDLFIKFIVSVVFSYLIIEYLLNNFFPDYINHKIIIIITFIICCVYDKIFRKKKKKKD